MARAEQLHAFECLMRSFITLDHGAQLARHVTDFHRHRIAVRDDDAIHYVALGKDTEQFPLFVNDANSADVALSHKLRRFLHGGGSLRRVRLTVANHVADKHRSASWSRG